MNEEKEAFLSRWSRLKQEQAREKPALPLEERQAENKEQAPAPLPPVEQLTPESDFAPFMNPKVDGETRRTALKKLFADPHFNVPDPFEAYSEDYTVGEPIPIEMLKTLNHAKRLLFDEPEQAAQAATETSAGQAETTPADAPPQDPKDAVGKQDA